VADLLAHDLALTLIFVSQSIGASGPLETINKIDTTRGRFRSAAIEVQLYRFARE